MSKTPGGLETQVMFAPVPIYHPFTTRARTERRHPASADRALAREIVALHAVIAGPGTPPEKARPAMRRLADLLERSKRMPLPHMLVPAMAEVERWDESREVEILVNRPSDGTVVLTVDRSANTGHGSSRRSASARNLAGETSDGVRSSRHPTETIFTP